MVFLQKVSIFFKNLLTTGILPMRIISREMLCWCWELWVIPLLRSSCVCVGFCVYVSVLVFVSIWCLCLSVSLCDPDSVCPCPSIIISECVFVSLSCVSLGLCPYVCVWGSVYVAVWFLNAEIMLCSRLCKSRIKGSGFKICLISDRQTEMNSVEKCDPTIGPGHW